MNHIVVAIEFDEELDDVIEFTANLVTGTSTEIHIVHAYQAYSEVVNYAPYMVKAIESYEEATRQQSITVNRMAEMLCSKGITAHGYMKPIERNVVDTILEFANEKQAGLIVVGTHHPKHLERMLLGSVTEKLVRQSDIPVAVVPRKQAN